MSNNYSLRKSLAVDTCMFQKIKVVPLAEESFGVRSMCTFVETPDVRILLDAGASLGPVRFGFSPHPREYEALAESRRKIAEAADKAEVVTISHYHFDHHTPSYTDWFTNYSSEEIARQIYEDKLVLAKSFRDKVNFHQRRRGWIFSKTAGRTAKKLEFCDGKTYHFGQTVLKFSEPVFHGSGDSQLGWLLMTTVEHENERLLFTSDVQGPMYAPTLPLILDEKPQLAIVGGPPAYLEGLVNQEDIKAGMENLKDLVSEVPKTIVGHHLLRAENWQETSAPIFSAASENGRSAVTAAQFSGKENNLLESQRKQLFETEPPNDEFKRWMKLPVEQRRLSKPPV